MWALPYTENGAVAFATDRREIAEKAQESLLRVGLVPDDSLDYWEAPIGRVVPAAARRLAFHCPSACPSAGSASVAGEVAALGPDPLSPARRESADEGICQFIVPTPFALAATRGTGPPAEGERPESHGAAEPPGAGHTEPGAGPAGAGPAESAGAGPAESAGAGPAESAGAGPAESAGAGPAEVGREKSALGTSVPEEGECAGPQR